MTPMTAESKPSDNSAKNETDGLENGRFIWPARVGWLMIIVFFASMLMVNLPHLFRDTLTDWQVGEAMPTGLKLFSSSQAFVTFVITLRLVTMTIFMATALFLASRKWSNGFVLFVSATLLMLGYLFGMQFDFDVIRYPDWVVKLFPAISGAVPVLVIFCMLLLFYLFPNGRFVPRWFGLLLIPALLVIIDVFGNLFNPLWDSLLGRLLANGIDWWTLFTSLLLGTAVLCMISQLVRYRFISSIEQRQQTKWVLLGLAAITATPILLFLIIDVLNVFSYSARHFISIIVETSVPVLLPITIAISITRYKLWEVDSWINRALVYGMLTAVILILYGLGVGLVSVLLPTATNWLVPALALIFIVMVVSPLYGRIHKWVDRLIPVNRLPEADSPTTETPKPSWPMRLAQFVWLLMLAYATWQMVAGLFSFEQLSQETMREWLVQESTRGFSTSTAENVGSVIVANGIWTLAISTATAVLIFWRKRNDRMALYVAFLLLLAPFGITPGNSNPGPIEQALSFIGIGILFFFPFVFPTGQFVPRSWKWRGMLVVTILFLPILFFALARLIRPDVSPDEQSYLTFVFMLTAVLGAGMISQIFRYRFLSNRVQRRQTRWVLVAFAAQIAWFGWVVLWISTLPDLFFPESFTALITLLGALITSTLLPLSIAIAILYDRLWQIDVVLNRTLVFGGLTVLVVFLYVLVVGILGALLQSGNNLLLSVLATGLIAVLFDPLRRRLQRSVNQLMYGQRDDPFAVMSELGRQLEMTAIPGETLSALVQTIGQTLKLPFVAIVLGEEEVIASVGAKTSEAPQSFPLVYQANTIGQLQVARRGNNEKFTVEEEHLLLNVARHAGTAVYAEQLTNQLQRSRERLVTTREEERRRLRRDLHDGLGPQLATLTVKVGAAQNLLRTDPDGANHLLDQVRAESQKAIMEIRRVVNDLRPSALDQLGLLSALREFVAQYQAGGTLITLYAPDKLPPLPAAVEVAAYRIVTEAITNTVRHTQARICTIHLEIGEMMNLKIDDNGNGLAENYQSGVGLSSMRERAVELGGSFEIQSKPGQGTLLTVRLPIAGDE
jgi:signal transduction histidine kinase